MSLPSRPNDWDLTNAKVVDHLDRKALIGTAFLKDIELEDGIIECDIAMKGGSPLLSRRSFQSPVSGGIRTGLPPASPFPPL